MIWLGNPCRPQTFSILHSCFCKASNLFYSSLCKSMDWFPHKDLRHKRVKTRIFLFVKNYSLYVSTFSIINYVLHLVNSYFIFKKMVHGMPLYQLPSLNLNQLLKKIVWKFFGNILKILYFHRFVTYFWNDRLALTFLWGIHLLKFN